MNHRRKLSWSCPFLSGATEVERTPTRTSAHTMSLSREEGHGRVAILNLFVGLFLGGSVIALLLVVIYDNAWPNPGLSAWKEEEEEEAKGIRATIYLSRSAWNLIVCSVASSSVLLVSLLRPKGNYRIPLVLFCVVLDALLSSIVLLDRHPRSNLFLWFVCIPLLLLYTNGTRSCYSALAAVTVQIVALRAVRSIYLWPTADPPHENDVDDSDLVMSPLRRTVLGESYLDCWLIVLITAFSARSHGCRSRALAELQSAKDDLERAHGKLQRATKAKSSLLANVSHELRTPIHGIVAICQEIHEDLQLAAANSSSEKKTLLLARRLGLIRESAEHLLNLINDLLDLERMDRSKFVIHKAPFSITAETASLVDMMRITAAKKRITLREVINLPWSVRLGDAVRYRQIAFNLLSNAIKFTPEGGEVELGLHESASEHQVLLLVRDNGIGIPPDELPRIFKSFSQVDNSSPVSQPGGSGLGLAICKKLCRAMKGTIECESKPGQGSVFRVRLELPRAVNVAPPMADMTRNFAGTKALVVDDNAVNRKVAKRMLQILGCAVRTTENGAECLRKIENEHYDVVLMDCRMPVMDGFEATRRIKQKLSERLPIIGVTASATQEYRERCLEAGMNDAIVKPFDRNVLAPSIEFLIRQGDEESSGDEEEGCHVNTAAVKNVIMRVADGDERRARSARHRSAIVERQVKAYLSTYLEHNSDGAQYTGH